MTQARTSPSAGAAVVRRRRPTPSPRRVGRWEILEPVAEGSIGRVYRARAVGWPGDRPAPYAVKLLGAEWESDARAVGQFRREVEISRQVAHPHVVPILAAGIRRPPYYLVMPWLEGHSLGQRLAADHRLAAPEALWIARQVAEAMAALAAAGWQHGDIKPANVFLSPDGHVTLLDLGLARRLDQPDEILQRAVCGTLAYLAPERLTSVLAGDARSDVYSLGAVLYEMLSGRPPFVGDSIEDLAASHRQTRPPKLRILAGDVPPAVARLVERMLSKEPLRRPQTAAELVESLTRLEIESFAERAKA